VQSVTPAEDTTPKTVYVGLSKDSRGVITASNMSNNRPKTVIVGLSKDSRGVITASNISQNMTLEQIRNRKKEILEEKRNRLQQIQNSVQQQTYTGNQNKEETKLKPVQSQPTGPRSSPIFIEHGKVQERQAPKIIGTVPNPQESKTYSLVDTPKTKAMRERVAKLEERDVKFFGSPGFQRIKESTPIGFYVVAPPVAYALQKWYPPGYQAGLTAIEQLMSAPISIGGYAPSVGGKISAFAEGVFNPDVRPNIIPELGRSAKETAQIYTKPETYAVAGISALTILPNAQTNWVVRKGMTTLYKDKYVLIEQTGLNFVESETIPRSINDLKGFENKQAKTVHTTDVDFFKSSDSIMLESQPKAGKLRTKYNLYNFYKSTPENPISPIIDRVPAPLQSNFPASVWDFSIDTGKPNAYLGYLGITQTKSVPSDITGIKKIYNKPTGRFYIGEDVISKTPSVVSKQNVIEINKYQLQKSGETFIPAENFAGLRNEGQFISPSKYVNVPGYENTPGSILQKVGDKTFSYYTQKRVNPYENAFSRGVWDVFGKKQEVYKFEFQNVKTVPVGETVTLDLPVINKFVSPEPARYVGTSSPSVVRSGAGLPQITGSIPKFGDTLSAVSNGPSLSEIRVGLGSPKSSYRPRSENSFILSPSRSPESSPVPSPSPSPKPSKRSSGPSVPSEPYPSIIPPRDDSPSVPPPSIPPPSIPPPSGPSSPPKNIPSIPPPSIPPNHKHGPSKVSNTGFVLFGKSNKQSYGFNVFVREKRVFVKKNINPYSRSDALQFGANIVRNTASATFKIEPAQGRVSKYYGPKINIGAFKQKQGLYIQPTRKSVTFPGARISSGGEVRQISLKGISSPKNKKWRF
jgi:hypothetical protein